MGGDVVTLRSVDNQAAVRELKEKFNLSPVSQDGNITFNVPKGEQFLPLMMESFRTHLVSIGIRRPTLDDVFLKLTGRAIREEEAKGLKAEFAAMMRRH
jgi:ABC-2 type transport system ATP-binding protein